MSDTVLVIFLFATSVASETFCRLLSNLILASPILWDMENSELYLATCKSCAFKRSVVFCVVAGVQPLITFARNEAEVRGYGQSG